MKKKTFGRFFASFNSKKVPLTLCKSAAFAVKTIEFCVFEVDF